MHNYTKEDLQEEANTLSRLRESEDVAAVIKCAKHIIDGAKSTGMKGWEEYVVVAHERTIRAYSFQHLADPKKCDHENMKRAGTAYNSFLDRHKVAHISNHKRKAYAAITIAQGELGEHSDLANTSKRRIIFARSIKDDKELGYAYQNASRALHKTRQWSELQWLGESRVKEEMFQRDPAQIAKGHYDAMLGIANQLNMAEKESFAQHGEIYNKISQDNPRLKLKDPPTWDAPATKIRVDDMGSTVVPNINQGNGGFFRGGTSDSTAGADSNN